MKCKCGRSYTSHIEAKMGKCWFCMPESERDAASKQEYDLRFKSFDEEWKLEVFKRNRVTPICLRGWEDTASKREDEMKKYYRESGRCPVTCGFTSIENMMVLDLRDTRELLYELAKLLKDAKDCTAPIDWDEQAKNLLECIRSRDPETFDVLVK